MSTLSFDGQSFSVDGRRIWLVSGAIHYSRTPHQLWRRRIRAAREAGLNCIETYVFWNLHEPSPGRFNFKGDLDLRRFVQTVGDEGMYCIIRPGPYICGEWDFGGLPAWLHRAAPANTSSKSSSKGEEEIPTVSGDGALRTASGIKLRQSDPAFLEACSRYLTAVMEQIHDLQITAPLVSSGSARTSDAAQAEAAAAPIRFDPAAGNRPGQPAGGFTGGGRGPILMIQAENEWFCSNPDEAQTYLREIVRYLRENGCQVPINNCNNLWQPIEGTISTWNGARNLATDMRQLAVVQPDAPRLVTEYWPGWFDAWGQSHTTVDPGLHFYRLAGILATGSMYNLYMFHGGTNFGFHGGRTVSSADCFMTTSYDYDAPLLEAGGRGEKYALTKRISTFASQFGHVFAHLDPKAAHTAAAPGEDDGHPLSIIQCSGAQGEVVFVLRSAADSTRQVRVMLPDGLSLPVELGDERAAWFLLNVNLGGVATLDYTNLRPWAFLDKKTLILYGPAGTQGLVSIDGMPLQVKVPEAGGDEPLIDHQEDLTIVVLNTRQVDGAYLFEGGLVLGADGLDDLGRPIVPGGAAGVVIIDRSGTLSRSDDKPTRKPRTPRLSGWEYAGLGAVLDGSDEGFEKIDGPTALAQLKCDYGYGWYRLSLGKSQTGNILAPLAGDRLHVYTGGELQGVLGLAPGAQGEPTNLKLGGQVVILADNLGRFNYGQSMGELKGLFGPIYKVRPARLNKPRIVNEWAADPFVLTGLVMQGRKGERIRTDSVIWTVKPAGRKPMILEITGSALRGMLLVNDQPFALYLGDQSGRAARFILTPGERGFTGGQNRIKFSPLTPLSAKVKVNDHVKLYQTTAEVTARADWAFQKWATPPGDAFGKPPRSAPSQPGWWRCSFNVSGTDTALWFEPRGMTKGQLFVNGRNVGRYFVATHEGKAVGPQRLYYLPEPWLNVDKPNELLVFDEHGKSPVKGRLVYDSMGPYHKQ